MGKDEVIKDVINQHECAMKLFKDGYSFDTKQKDIVFYITTSLRKHQSEQLSDQNKVDILNKKIDKRQILIDDLINRLEISKSVTEMDVVNDRE